MQNPNETRVPGGLGGKSKPGTTQPGKERDGERGNQEPSKQGGRPSPSGVPNEGRRSEAPGGNQKPGQGGELQGSRDGQGGMQTPRKDSPAAYEYKGGRQGTGGIPNPDDADDGESAGSFRGTQLRNPK